MYEESFSRDWDGDTLDREEAVWRAYALGVAAALGEQNREEYRELVAAVGRPLVEMAYDEGKTSAANLDSRLAAGEADLEPADFPSREDAVWSKLVSYRQGEGDQVASGGGGNERLGLPEFLERIDFDSLDRDDLDRLRLPEFLSGR